MITADPQRRVSTLARILAHVGRTAPDADRDLLLALAPVVYGTPRHRARQRGVDRRRLRHQHDPRPVSYTHLTLPTN